MYLRVMQYSSKVHVIIPYEQSKYPFWNNEYTVDVT
jgi:hypothetical protein